jgi:uncharacterized protein YbjT (DUF2867 family)
MNILITGATGMVGEGVLIEALGRSDVERVTLLGRRPSGVQHPKVREIVQENLFDLSAIASQLTGFDACLYCLGTTSIGKKEGEYTRITYDLTMAIARALSSANPNMTFCYISGKATNSQSRQMWARVKGKTEDDLRMLPFKSVYAFRPGLLLATKGQRRTLNLYRYFAWLYPVVRLLYPSGASTMQELGQAMINVAANGYPKSILEVPNIIAASRNQSA